MPIKFGTDGWRALMDTDFTFQNVERVAQAFADTLNTEFSPALGAPDESVRKRKPFPADKPAVAIGYDTRENSENFAKTFAEVLIANGIRVFFSDSVSPTPAVSFAVVNRRCQAGIMVTASHNPPRYNGIKIKAAFGGSADKSLTDAVESFIDKSPVRKKPFSAGNPVLSNFNAAYLDALKKYLRLDAIKAAPYRLLVDSMHGTGARHIETILSGGRIRVTTIRGERDTRFGGTNPEPIPKNLLPAMEAMKSGDFDLCVVTDGDADRVGAVAPGGRFISPGIILSLILLHFVEDLGRKGSVVTTISNTALVYKVARKLGLQVHETPVGFKYVCEIMRRENVLIGGEESGGIGFQNYLYERDGMLSGLLLVEMMAMRNKSFVEILSGIEAEFGRLYYVRRDLEYPNELKSKLFDHLRSHAPATLRGQKVKEVKKNDGVKFILQDDSWLLFRLSGTEPILRIYAEATSEALAEGLVRDGQELAFNVARVDG